MNAAWHAPKGLSVLIFLPVPQTTAKEEARRPRDGRPCALDGGATRADDEIMEAAIAACCFLFPPGVCFADR